MKKMMTISTNLNTFAGVAKVLFKAAAIIIAVCVVILLFVSPHHEMWRNGTYSLELGNVTLELIPDGAIPAEVTRRTVIGGLIFCIPLFLLIAKCLGIVQDILTPMSQGQPFEGSVADSLRQLSLFALIGGGIAEAGNLAISALRLGNIKLDALFNPDLVAGYTVEHVMNMNFILFFAVLYLMSHVFRYGEQLQQLSDETL